MCGIKSSQTGPGRIVLAIFSWFWRPIHQLQSQHGKVKLQGIRKNTDPVVQHAVRFGMIRQWCNRKTTKHCPEEKNVAATEPNISMILQPNISIRLFNFRLQHKVHKFMHVTRPSCLGNFLPVLTTNLLGNMERSDCRECEDLPYCLDHSPRPYCLDHPGDGQR